MQDFNISSNREHTLLTERYRPDTLEGFLGNDKLLSSIKKQLDEGDIQNYIFYGPPGGGKTTLAKIIVKGLDCDYLMINGTDERGMDILRDKIKTFASTASFNPIKVVIIDEADFLLQASQGMLRHIIEQFSRNTRFIFTCNYIEKMMEPLQSRCQVYKVIPPSKPDVAKHLQKILIKENIEFEKNDLASIVNNEYPDIRKMLNIIQSSSKSGKLELDKTITHSSDYTEKVIKALKGKNPNFNEIRQIIVDSNENSYENLFRSLWDNSEVVLPGKEGTLAVILNETAYEANFSLDKEINCMSCIAKIINNK